MSFLRDLIIRIKGDKTQLDSTLKGAEGSVSKFGMSIGKLAGIISGVAITAFATLVKVMKSTEGTMDTLDKITSTFKGGFQGLMRTIATGDWGGLIDNITKTAKAYRDLKIAQDQMADVEASNVLKKSYLEKDLQSARIAAASAQDPALKAQYLQEAIAAQKAITEINLSEIKTRIEDYEKSYKTLAGFDDEATALMIQNFRKIAGNYEAFYGKDGKKGQLVLLQLQKEGLAYKDQLGILTDVEKAQYNQVRAAVANLEVFKEFRDNLKPEEFNDYIKLLGSWNDAIAAGDQSLIRLTTSLNATDKALKKVATIHKIKLDIPSLEELNSFNDQISNILTGKSAKENKLQLAPTTTKMPKVNDAQQAWVDSWKQATDEVTSLISDAFIGLWESIGSGSFEGFGDELLSSFGRFIASFGKMLVAMGSSMLLALTLMKVPSIPTALAAIAAGGVAMAIGGLMMGMANKQANNMTGGSSGSSSYSGQSSQRIIVEGRIRGKDIWITNRRYAEDN
jgi:hypothetical protein